MTRIGAGAISLDSRLPLNDGNSIPALGLGVYQSPAGRVTHESVSYALSVGYRHIDTAAIYGNEADVGRAILDSGIPRSEVFVTTKLWNQQQGYDSALRALERSLALLRMEYVDLYLVHWPVPGKRQDSWRALEKLKADGRARSIGVSNYTVHHLQDLLSNSGTAPAINQVEFSPFLFQQELLAFCTAHRIQLEAYSPLARGQRFRDSTLLDIAKRHQKSPAQIMVRWALELGLVVIPKSVRPGRILENASVFDFELSPMDHERLAALNENLRTDWDPSDTP
jgi:diketogulonate reductase-like aldo/keto reductase